MKTSVLVILAFILGASSIVGVTKLFYPASSSRWLEDCSVRIAPDDNSSKIKVDMAGYRFKPHQTGLCLN